MNRVALFVILIFFSRTLRAQSNFRQITFGGGFGGADAYAGAQVQKITFSGYGEAGYCPSPFINLNIQVQAGSLAGASLNTKNPKSFNSHYVAPIINARILLGVFVDDNNGAFLNAVKNIYLGAGYGVMNNNISNADLANPAITDNVKNTIGIVPFTLGYEYNILGKYDVPVLKIDLSYTSNYTISRGLDGYYTNSKAFYFYNYIAVGFKYALTIRPNRMRGYNRFD